LTALTEVQSRSRLRDEIAEVELQDVLALAHIEEIDSGEWRLIVVILNPKREISVDGGKFKQELVSRSANLATAVLAGMCPCLSERDSRSNCLRWRRGCLC
jgi:hypothetical protein